MTGHPAPRRTLLAAQQTTWFLHVVIALFVVIGLLLVALAVAVAVQVRDDEGRIWAPGPFASSSVPHRPV